MSTFVNGQEATVLAARALSERVLEQDDFAQLPAESLQTIWGLAVERSTHTLVHEAILRLRDALSERQITSATLSSGSLIDIIPDLYQIKTGTVLHVAAGNEQYESFADFEHTMALRHSGFSMLCSASVQEAYDFAIIAQVAALKTNSPILHFFDSRRISQEYTQIDTIAHDLLRKLVQEDDVTHFKEALAEPSTASIPSYKAQKDEEHSHYEAIAKVMQDFAALTGRQYSPTEYIGDKTESHAVLAMGAGVKVMAEAQGAWREKATSVGVIKVSLYRPFSEDTLRSILPSTVKRIAVLEPVHERASAYNPLFLDVVAAFQLTGRDDIDLLSGQYGVTSPDVSPRNVFNVFALLNQAEPPRKFVLEDLKVQPNTSIPSVVSSNVEQVILVGECARAKELARSAASDKAVQLYTIHLDGTPVSHIRFGPKDTTLIPSLIDTADLVVLSKPSSQSQASVDAVLRAKEGGRVVTLEKDLPDLVKKALGVRKVVIGYADQQALAPSSLETIKAVTAETAPETWASIAGTLTAPTVAKVSQHTAQALETPYLRMLEQAFGSRLDIANAVHSASVWSKDANHPSSATPEFGYGKLVSLSQQRSRLIDAVENFVKNNASLPESVVKPLSSWLVGIKSHTSKASQINEAASKAIEALQAAGNTALIAQPGLFYRRSNWLVGSDDWACDLGQSGVHHVVASGENINMLIIDTQSYSSPNVESDKRKKDIGLYAMNFGNVYVASVALYSSYTGVLHALMEADAYQGPSIVLAYLPQPNGVDSLETLKETKISVDTGAWPLYRWNPALESAGKEPFSLDSQRIKKDLEAFLERENLFSQVVQDRPDLSTLLVGSLEANSKKRHRALKRKARDDYAKLLSGLGSANGPPLTVLFASDNGNAEGVAKKIATRGSSRGLRVKLMAMDDYGEIEELASETNVLIIASTAGQGEFPSNGRDFWKALNGLVPGDIQLGDVHFAVFGLGDSHYWPREEDTIFYNRPGKLLDAKLETLGATRLVDIGLGDDQDDDGFETGLQAWQPLFWKSLGVHDAGAEDDVPKLTDDQMKINSNFLRGTIAEDLRDETTGAVSEINGKLLKFHGSYGQDDRDLREERKKMGLEKAFSFMIRVRMPGGVSSPEQWLAIDKLAGDYANGAIKLTTRQAFQLHGVLKKDLRTTIRGINHCLLSTLAACGDVNRNIMVTPVTEIPEVHHQVQDFATEVMHRLAPKTNAYHEIWLADELVAGHAVQDFEPIYGPTYLPRKFKIVIAVPPNNDVDIFAHDLGFIAIVDPATKQVAGYNVTIGGGMGMTHGNKKTYPRPASIIGYIPASDGVDVAEAILTTQRDFGDRTNRKHARFKYTIDDHGLDVIKAEIEKRSGVTFEEPKPYVFTDNADRYGWTKGVDDKWHFCMFIENGKVKDWPDFPVRTGLRELATWHKGEFRLTPNQHLVIANVPESDLERTKEHLKKYKMDNLAFTGLRLNAMACVALPTCGLAMAESERYLPTLVTHLEDAIEEAGLRDDAITIRMTGCPNGCARPYLAELAFVGKAPGAYNVYLGGGHKGERLNKLFKESLREDEILATVKPIIKRYALERNGEEPFGDWVIRAGFVKQTITGTDFHDV